MGKRSRKRMDHEELGGAEVSRAERDEARRRRAAAQAKGAGASAGGGRAARGRRGTAERPPAPWGNFPLSELCVFLALVLGVGALVVRGDKGRTMILAAMALGSIAGLELSIRDHFAGYRSHTSLLAGSLAFATVTIILVTGVSRALGPVAIVGAVVFAAGVYVFRQAFKRRSGGLGFR